ncbi:hypothetical protein [Photobacterium damselae]|uniref:hypothetical protein n=1 Tax=Photobacterium damselae TaxID=38293 RepID=UPI000DFF5BCB|nr:hypothetical protein [Photobacterium damselae]SUB90817.1 Uncharacterised protein [Photobacterium damselae]
MKKTSIAFILAIISQSAFSANGIIEQDFDVLNYGNVEQVRMTKAAGRNHWDVSYEYATQSGHQYEARLHVKPIVNSQFSKQPVEPQSSALIIGPFKMPISLEAFNRFTEQPSELTDFLAHTLPMVPMDLFGSTIKADIKDVSFDERSAETIISFSFESQEKVDYLPVTAGFAGIWTDGVPYPTMMASIAAGEMDADFVCNNATKKCSTKLFGTDDPSSQLFKITN